MSNPDGYSFKNREFAASYDAMVERNGWRGGEIFLELLEGRFRPGEKLLDLGIGTGTSAVPFARAGLRIYGVDYSREMLDICAAKKIAVDLKQVDLIRDPIPYPDAFFDHAAAIAVFPYFRDIEPLFTETSRVLRREGSFAFLADEYDSARPRTDVCQENKDLGLRRVEGFGGNLFCHSDSWIRRMIGDHSFRLEIKKQIRPFLEFQNDHAFVFSAYVVRKL